MALNMQDQTNPEEEGEGEKPQPIVHDPAPKTTHWRGLFVVIFILAVAGATLFLLYEIGVFSGKQKPKTQTGEVVQLPHDTAGPPPVVATPETATPQRPEKIRSSQESEKKPSPEVSTHSLTRSSGNAGEGSFAVIVGVFRKKENADRELKRLKAAGVDASIDRRGELYRVSFGHYATRDEAEAMVMKNRGLVPNGYAIGKTQ